MGFPGKDTPAPPVRWSAHAPFPRGLFGLLTVAGRSRRCRAGTGARRDNVDVIQVEGAIDRPLLGYLDDQLDAAVATRRGRAAAGQRGLDGGRGCAGPSGGRTPGPVLVWVGPCPHGRAAPGLLLMYARRWRPCARVADGTAVPGRPAASRDVPPDLDATIASWLEARGRTRLERPDEAMPGAQAVAYGSPMEPFRSPSCSTRSMARRCRRLRAGCCARRSRPPSPTSRTASVTSGSSNPGRWSRFKHAVATPSMVFFLLVFGLAGLAFELTQPGFGFAGFAGLFLVALAVYGLTVATPLWPGSS